MSPAFTYALYGSPVCDDASFRQALRDHLGKQPIAFVFQPAAGGLWSCRVALDGWFVGSSLSSVRVFVLPVGVLRPMHLFSVRLEYRGSLQYVYSFGRGVDKCYLGRSECPSWALLFRCVRSAAASKFQLEVY